MAKKSLAEELKTQSDKTVEHLAGAPLITDAKKPTPQMVKTYIYFVSYAKQTTLAAPIPTQFGNAFIETPAILAHPDHLKFIEQQLSQQVGKQCVVINFLLTAELSRPLTQAAPGLVSPSGTKKPG